MNDSIHNNALFAVLLRPGCIAVNRSPHKAAGSAAATRLGVRRLCFGRGTTRHFPSRHRTSTNTVVRNGFMKL